MYKLTLAAVAVIAFFGLTVQTFAAEPEKTSASTSIPDMSGIW